MIRIIQNPESLIQQGRTVVTISRKKSDPKEQPLPDWHSDSYKWEPFVAGEGTELDPYQVWYVGRLLKR